MSRNSRKKEKLARKQADRALGRRRKRDDDDERGNGYDNDDQDNETQFKDRNSRKEDYRM